MFIGLQYTNITYKDWIKYIRKYFLVLFILLFVSLMILLSSFLSSSSIVILVFVFLIINDIIINRGVYTDDKSKSNK